ncbi:hypothetical protein GO986_18055 [Deinococcus sp. HMF7620]|uniref:Uncharacterized protein n=1 Tax=Deinococcus arboris TaxID=2682977 RepID=A0A7C9MAU5_9DEIO|nr:hypothetical protein [Deinococcus arboris]MVN88643.1 hypothetical protein [Deinococcus arboris]
MIAPSTLPLINWRLTVRDWDGTFRHERSASHATAAQQVNIPADGLEASHNGYGDCLELTFQAIWPTLGAKGRDLLELDTQDTAGVWTRRWAGVVVKSGNAMVSWGHTNFKAAGLKKRCGEVRVPVDLAEGDVGAQARQAIQAVLDSGQLGQAILLDPALIPDVGVPLGKVEAKNRTLTAVLDYLSAQGGQAWGVNEHRFLFWRPLTTGTGDVLSLTETVTTPGRAVTATFEDADAEALVTRVLFNVGAWDDGTPITHEVQTEHEARYGVAWKEVPLDPSVPSWATVPFTLNLLRVAQPTAAQLALLTDRLTADASGTRAGWDAYTTSPGQETWVELVTQAPMQRLVIDAVWDVDQAQQAGCKLEIRVPGSALVQNAFGRYNGATGKATLQEMVETRGEPLPAGTAFRFYIPENTLLNLAELRPEVLDTGLLAQLATYHLILPSRDPASVRVPWPVTPRPTLSLRRLLGDVYEAPVEVVRLMIKLGEPGVSVVQTGQRESAESAATRFLARRALDEATLTAIRAAKAGP